MKKYYIPLFILLLFACELSGQNYKKAFKNLDKGDFENAKVIFDDIIRDNDNSVVGNYGLSLVYSNTEYRGNDYFKSYKHLINAKKYFAKLTSEQKNEISDYVTASLIQKQNEIVDENLFQFVKTKNSLSLINEFLKDCKDSKYYKTVIDIRNDIEFQHAKEYNSISVYENFISKYPNSKEAPLAKALIIEMVFANVKAKNTISDYENFIKEYPQSDEAKTAKELLIKMNYEFAIKMNSIDTYNNFINKYPDAPQLAEIIKLRNQKAYDNAVIANSIDGYTQFIKLYPESNKIPKVILIRDSLAFQLAKTTNTYESYNAFLEAYPSAKQKNDAKKLQKLLNENKKTNKILEERLSIKNSKLKSCVGYKYNYVSGSPKEPKIRIIEKSYDTNGCITELFDNLFGKNQTTIYSYNTNNELITKELSQSGKIKIMIFFKYDAQGSKSEETTKCMDKDFVGCSDQTVKYRNGANLEILESYTISITNDTVLIIKYQYDNDGKLSNEIIYKKNEIAGYLVSKITYKYDLSGHLIQKQTYNNSKAIENVESYKYDENSNLIEKIIYNAIGEKRITYKYNAKNFLIEETDWDNKTNEVNYRIEYIYNFY
ncbi:MAG: hypothetical protein K9J13_02305 [Saprospiraceae bacterium]|nr:hypothetical protein [Saprospiraceae bacterium]